MAHDIRRLKCIDCKCRAGCDHQSFGTGTIASISDSPDIDRTIAIPLQKRDEHHLQTFDVVRLHPFLVTRPFLVLGKLCKARFISTILRVRTGVGSTSPDRDIDRASYILGSLDGKEMKSLFGLKFVDAFCTLNYIRMLFHIL